MTEEEKKAILYLNKYIDTDLTYESQHYSYIRMLIRLVGKQQKEIEELKKPKDNIQVVYGGRSYGKTLEVKNYITKEYISKDKIEKELLEPINKERQETYKEFMKKSKDDYHGVEGSVLQELNWVVGTIEELLEE